jgi:hypothetical protein
MKVQKSITIDNNLINQLLQKFPNSRRNFSALVEGCLIAVLNNPAKYWQSKAKYHAQMLNMCQSQAQFFRECNKNNIKEEERKNILCEVIKNG